MKLRDKVALVTGAGRGIGRAICARYIEEGAFVFVTDIDEVRARSVATEPGQQTAALRLDVTSQESTDGMITAVVAQRSRLDI
jgi:NAD(P)-dependent dehydrogenase (short-subunit alcohol dehydrogenase family)